MQQCDELTTASHGRAVGPGKPALAVDVGGTAIKIGLIDPRGVITDGLTVPTPKDESDVEDRIVDLIGAAVDEVRRRHGGDAVSRISMVAPGIVDDARGRAVYSANLGWRNVHFQQKIKERIGVPGRMSHDVRAAGLAEFSEAGTARNAVMITIGTGIAAALRIDGRSFSSGGYAGEIGFLEVGVMTPEGPFVGPLEDIASTRAIAETYSRRSGREVNGSAGVLAKVGEGDLVAEEVWHGALEAMNQACHQIVTLLAPEVIIFGGGLSEEASICVAIAERLEGKLSFHRKPTLLRTRLGASAGLIGAAMLTREKPSVHLFAGLPEGEQPESGGSESA